MAQNKIPARSEINPADTWAIEDIFPSDQAWAEAVAQVIDLGNDIARYQGHLGESAKNLYDYCTTETKINELIDEIYGYASRRYDVDTTNGTYQAMNSRATAVYVEISGKLAFSGPEILAIDDSTLEEFFKEVPQLNVYRRSINEIRRLKDHILLSLIHI